MLSRDAVELDSVCRFEPLSLLVFPERDHAVLLRSHKDEKQEDLLSILREEVETLDEVERSVVSLFYGEGMSQKEIAQKLTYSPSKVCRIHMKLLKKLKRRLARAEEADG